MPDLPVASSIRFVLRECEFDFEILRCRFLRKGTLFMAGGRPPAFSIAAIHTSRALLRASSMLAMAVAYRRSGDLKTRVGDWFARRLRRPFPKNRDSNGMANSVGL